MTSVLLLRGVNVGGAKRLPMAGLRDLLARLGCTQVRTLLNSGNAVFEAPPRATTSALTTAIETAIEATFGFGARSFVLAAADLDTVVRENTLASRVDNPSRLLVAFLRTGGDRTKLAGFSRNDWGTGLFALGSRAAYLWCPEGILDSPLPDAVGRALRDEVTTRNWATVLRLQAACQR